MKDYICVIGGSNIDISSTAFNPLILHDSNPSRITLSLGGVARNVAENLARMSAKVELITVFGNDENAEKIKRSCEKLSISTKYSATLDMPTSTYLCINDDKCDMYVAASDMRILDALDQNYLAARMNVLNGAKAVVIDTNLSKETLDFVLRECKTNVFVETVSANKAKKLIGLSGAYAIKPNVIEAEILTNMRIASPKDLPYAAKSLHDRGYKKVVITLGENGAYYSDGAISGIVKEENQQIVNTTGAGDSFFAAFVLSTANGQDIKTACECGNRVAKLTLQSPLTVNPLLTSKILEKR